MNFPILTPVLPHIRVPLFGGLGGVKTSLGIVAAVCGFSTWVLNNFFFLVYGPPVSPPYGLLPVRT